MRTTSSPSESVKNTASIRRAVGDPAVRRHGRPSDRFGRPTALFSRELTLLRYNLEHLEVFTLKSADTDRAFGLIENAVDFFDDESKREAALRPIPGQLLVGKNQRQY